MGTLPNGWRMLAIYPLSSNGKPADYIVCAEHMVLGQLIYVHARATDPYDMVTWIDVYVGIDHNVSMARALHAAGWNGIDARQ